MDPVAGRPLRAALDSMPLTRDPTRCRDHSASQVFGLTTSPLVAPSLHAETRAPALVGAREVHTSADARTHAFVVRAGLSWSSGAALTASHYHHLLQAALGEYPRSAESIWLRQVRDVELRGEVLTVRTRAPRHRFAGLMSLPALAPAAGRYAIRAWREDTIELQANSPWPGAVGGQDRSIHLVRVKEPEDNRELFLRGELDVTADTAFPYERVVTHLDDPHLRVTQPGIFAALTFEGRLADEDEAALRQRIREAIDQGELCRRLGGVLLPRRDFLPTAGDLRQRIAAACSQGGFDVPAGAERAVGPGQEGLRLAYHDYYPNRDLCLLVAEALRSAGIDVTLVEDSYEAPHQRADLRLSLMKGTRSGELGVYHGLLFLDLLRSGRGDCLEYLKTLAAFEAAPSASPDEVARSAGLLQDILDRRAAIVPLAEVPGIFLSRLAVPLLPGPTP